jgi:glycosyltransferase involved in cell wall biosynthesis
LLTNILKKNITNKKTQIVVLSNGVIIPLRFQNAEVKNQDVLNLLFVGRFASNKGIHILLEVIKELNDSGYEDKIVYNLAGKGPLWSHYSDNFKFKNVKYLGFVSDAQLLDLYTKNDLFILPTLFEGMPTVVLEAMSYSLPIIVTEVGATSELVNSSNGFLIKKNDVKALKEAIVTFYNLPKSEKAALGKGSLQIAKNNFTWEIVANKHIELFTFIKDAIH